MPVKHPATEHHMDAAERHQGAAKHHHHAATHHESAIIRPLGNMPIKPVNMVTPL